MENDRSIPAATEPENSTTPKNLPEALLVAALSGGAYWITFFYEAAYIGAFGLPAHLVEISVQTILTVVLGLSGLVWGLFLVVNLVVMLWPEHPAIQEKAFRIGIALLFPLWHLLNYGFRAQDWIFYVVILAFVGLFEIVWPLLVFRNKPTLRERFIADEAAESRLRLRGVAGRVFTGLGPAAYWLLLLFVVGGVLADTAGRAKATRQENFYTLASDSTLAVVRMYKDAVIAVPFDRATKTLEPGIVVMKIGNTAVSLVFEEGIGPLSREKVSEPTPKSDSTNTPMEGSHLPKIDSS